MEKEDEKNIAKIKIKPLRYSLMELREMNFLKRKGRPIPAELLNKPFEDFDVNMQFKSCKTNNYENLKIDEIKEEKKENSEISISHNSPKESNKSKSESNKSKSSSEKESGILQLKFCDDDENNSSQNWNDENEENEGNEDKQ